MIRPLLILAVAAPVLAGCASAGKVPEPQATPPVAYEAPRPAPDSLQPAALDRWWTLYGDAQLESLVDQALINAPDSRSALAVLEQAADVRSETIDQIYMPSGALSGTATRTHTNIIGGSTGGIGGIGGGFVQPGDTSSYNGSFNVGWELDLFGRRAAGRRSADADFYNAAFTYEATRTALIANVAQSLFQARGLALQLADAQETARIAHELERVTKAKVDHGLSANGDLDLTVATAEAADAQAESLRAQLDVARRSLLVLVGKGFDPLESLTATATVGTLPAVPATLPGDLLRRRPDVKAAEWRIVSAKGTLKVDELAVLPTLKLTPGVTLQDSTGVFGAASAAWSIGASLTAPVLDRPRLIAAMHAQRAVAEQDVIAYEKAVQTAYGDTETAFIYLDSDSRRVVTLTDAERHAESAYEKSRIGYTRGFSDLTATLQAETTWRNTRIQLANAQSTLMQRSVQVFKALGGGWAPEAPAASTPYAMAAAKGAEGGR